MKALSMKCPAVDRQLYALEIALIAIHGHDDADFDVQEVKKGLMECRQVISAMRTLAPIFEEKQCVRQQSSGVMTTERLGNHLTQP